MFSRLGPISAHLNNRTCFSLNLTVARVSRELSKLDSLAEVRGVMVDGVREVRVIGRLQSQ